MSDFLKLNPLIGSVLLFIAFFIFQIIIFYINKNKNNKTLLQQTFPLAGTFSSRNQKINALVLMIAIIGFYLVLYLDFGSMQIIADFLITITVSLTIHLFLFSFTLLIFFFIFDKNSTFNLHTLKRSLFVLIWINILLLLPLSVYTHVISISVFIFNFLIAFVTFINFNKRLKNNKNL